MGHDPELTLRVVNDGDGVSGGRANGPALAEEVNLVVSVDPTAQVNGQMEIENGVIGTGAQRNTVLGSSFGACLVRGQAGGAADGPILAGQLAGEQFLSGAIVRDFLVSQEG